MRHRAKRLATAAAILALADLAQAQTPVETPGPGSPSSPALETPAPAAPLLPAPKAPEPSGASPGAVPLVVSDIAYAAYQTGFYKLAMREATQRVAEDGNDAAAMTLIAELYRQGLGVQSDAVKAVEWYRLAHERGDANASFALAMASLEGQGAAKDQAAARRLLEEAAAKGQPRAAHNLGLLLLPSTDAAERRRAVGLLEVAARAEIGDAQHALAVLKREGRETPRDPEGAADLLRRSAGNGSLAGEIEYAIVLFNGQGVAKDELGAADIFERLAKRGNPIAQNRIARLYAAGRGRTRDPIEAAGWHLAASNAGLPDETLDRVFDNLSPADKARALDLARRRAPASLTAQQPSGQ